MRALIAGSSGITGSYLAAHLVELGWDVYGLARRPLKELKGVTPVAADMLQPTPLFEAVKNIKPTHVFFTTWLRQPTEEENCRVNGALVDNLLTALEGNDELRHVGLVTGGKSYFGSFSEIGKYSVTTPFREEQPRMPGLNFYATQEDIVFGHAEQRGLTWNVHRPCNSVIGYAPGNAMNMATTIAVYASLCKETGLPFVFPGNDVQYHGIAEVVDAHMVAAQAAWAANTPQAHNEIFNVGNGDLFRWDWMWGKIADYFGLEAPPYPGKESRLVDLMTEADSAWKKIVSKHKLQPFEAHDLAPWWHTDADLTRPFEAFPDLTKARALGFTTFKKSTTSFFDVFDRLRQEKIIPS